MCRRPLPAAPADATVAPVNEEGMETLTRGPIHEAFANPAEADPQPSPVVAEKPPPDVPEQPPAYQPEGNFLWLPGYYEWDGRSSWVYLGHGSLAATAARQALDARLLARRGWRLAAGQGFLG